MESHPVVSREEWLTARRALLAKTHYDTLAFGARRSIRS